MDHPRPRADIGSVFDPIQWRAGVGAVTLHVLAWWAILGLTLYALVELVLLIDEAYFVRQLSRGWGSDETRWLAGELVVWGMAALVNLVVLCFVLWWLGRLRRLWTTQSRPPRLATAATATIWVGLSILGEWMFPSGYRIGDPVSEMAYALQVESFLFDLGISLVLLGAAGLSGHQRRGGQVAST